jgi:hypothetical protein
VRIKIGRLVLGGPGGGGIAGARVSADDVTLDVSTWEPTASGSPLLVRSGVLLATKFVTTPPDLPAPLSQPVTVRESIAGSLVADSAALVDFEITDAGGGRWMRTIAKRRGEGRAIVYLGALQLHFATCWWLINMEARETGITGVREAMVHAVRASRGEAVESEYETIALAPGEAFPKPDPTRPLQRLVSDEPEWDQLVQDHPLSLVRAAQREILAGVRISPRARALRPFEGPHPRLGHDSRGADIAGPPRSP